MKLCAFFVFAAAMTGFIYPMEGAWTWGGSDVFGMFKIPALAAPDKALSEQVLWVHGLAAYILLGLVAMHIAAALYHYFIRGDGVLARMLPSLRREI